jgi:predicted nucleic acid-binding protein
VNSVFLDTSGLVAVVNMDDQWHATAEAAWHGLIASGTSLITTSLVLIEIGDGLSRVQHRQMAMGLYDRLRAAAGVEVVRVTAAEEEAGWELFRQRSDKEWGVTDCISMIVMRNRNVTDVFSVDHHFEQAGFHLLL